MNKLLLTAIIATSTCFSCTITEQITCEPGNLEINLTRFAKADLDSAIAIAYDADGTLSRVIDTLEVNATEAGYDTMRLTFHHKGQYRSIADHHPRVGCDYTLYIPMLNRWHTIASITIAGNRYETITRRKNDRRFYGCINHAVSCTLDNTRVPVVPGAAGVDVLYIRK